MLTNYYNYDENKTVSAFLREVKEKKNFNYIVLDTQPKTFVDVKTLSLKTHNEDEKLKTLKKKLGFAKEADKPQLLQYLIKTGELVVEYPKGFFDFLDGLKEIKNQKPQFLKRSLEEVSKTQVYALNPEDKISTARHIFAEQNLNLLPVINGELEVVGELRNKDLLTSGLYNKHAKDYYAEQSPLSVFNTPVENIMNEKPLTLECHKKVKDAIELLLEKKVPSVIITQDNQIFSIITYNDLFKMYSEETKQQEYSVEYVGFDDLFEDEAYFIKKVANKVASRLSKNTLYNELKITFKVHGNKDEGHLKKGEIICAAMAGKRIISVNKEISPGTSDEEFNDKKKEDWNIGKLTQQALSVLEEKIAKENKK